MDIPLLLAEYPYTAQCTKNQLPRISVSIIPKFHFSTSLTASVPVTSSLINRVNSVEISLYRAESSRVTSLQGRRTEAAYGPILVC
jgi:hypothetical protein